MARASFSRDFETRELSYGHHSCRRPGMSPFGGVPEARRTALGDRRTRGLHQRFQPPGPLTASVLLRSHRLLQQRCQRPSRTFAIACGTLCDPWVFGDRSPRPTSRATRHRRAAAPQYPRGRRCHAPVRTVVVWLPPTGRRRTGPCPAGTCQRPARAASRPVTVRGMRPVRDTRDRPSAAEVQ